MKRVKAKVHLLTGIFVLMALIVCSPSASWAGLTNVIDFNMDASHPNGAQISYGGGTAPLTGINIGVDTVMGLDGSGNVTQGPLSITNGILSFTTGNFSNYSPLTKTWTFSGGGNLSIAGSITSPITTSNTLLTGIFDQVQVVQFGSGTYKFDISGASFTNSLDSTLANYFFGSSGTSNVGGLNLSFIPQDGNSSSFSSKSVGSGDVSVSPVPIPGALMLFGPGMAGLILLRKRFTKQS